jgi:hypothetical protein
MTLCPKCSCEARPVVVDLRTAFDPLPENWPESVLLNCCRCGWVEFAEREKPFVVEQILRPAKPQVWL